VTSLRRGRPFVAVLIGLVALAAVVLAGCGGGGSSDSSGGYVPPKGPATETIEIDAQNFSFTPDKPTVKPGIANLKLVSKGGVHTLVFDGAYNGFLLEVSGSGDSQSQKIDLKPGKYTFYCNIPGHRAMGMEGTLTVTS
jgi:plastocyanin